jgi:Uma2 family endonuclease
MAKGDNKVARLTGPELERLGEEGAVRLELTAGIPTWEAFPGSRHQCIIDRIRASIHPSPNAESDCSCNHFSNVLIRFKDDSLKYPDIALFCTAPPDQDDALTMIPQAVIEVISPGYEYKDLSLNPQFYLAQDVLDVVVVDPRSGVVNHFRTTGVSNHHAPVTLDLLCGCRCVIPEVAEPAE